MDSQGSLTHRDDSPWSRVGDAAHTILCFLDRVDLRSACLVNKGWRCAAVPYLYSEFSCFYRPKYNYGDKPDKSFDYFLRTVLENKTLAQYVKTVQLRGDISWVSGGFMHPSIEISMFLKRAKLAIDGLYERTLIGRELREGLAKGIQQGSRDACVTLLLSQLPNMRRLRIGESYTGQTHLLGQYIWSATRMVPRQLLSLVNVDLLMTDRRCCLGYDGNHPQELTSHALPFFYLKNLTSLTASLCDPELFRWPKNQPPDLSSLSYLQLRMIREVHLKHILSLTTHLRSLDYQWSYDPNTHHINNPAVLQIDVIAEAVRQVVRSLQELRLSAQVECLDVEDEKDLVYPHIDIRGSLRSLQGFPILHTVTAPMFMLTSSWTCHTSMVPIGDVLPKSIRCVRVTDDLWSGYSYWDPKYYPPTFSEWFRTYKTTQPHLEKVCFMLVNRGIYGRIDREPMFYVGRQNGIEIVVQEGEDDSVRKIYRSTDKMCLWERQLQDEILGRWLQGTGAVSCI